MNVYLAQPNHCILLRHKPDPQYLRYLELSGIVLPGLLSLSEITDEVPWADIPGIQSALIVPYLVNEEIQSTAVTCGAKVYGCQAEIVKKSNDKFYVRKWAKENSFSVTEGYFCNNVNELEDAYKRLTDKGFAQCVLKIPYGSSGKGIRVIDNTRTFKHIKNFISKRNQSFELLLEGWHPICRSLNCQLLIKENEIKVLAVTEQHIDANGVYLGTDFTPKYDINLKEKYEQEMIRLGKLLQRQGYNGIAGVDSILDKTGLLIPIIEINARFTQVTYLLPVIQHLKSNYLFIQSCFIKIETEYELSFNELYEKVRLYLNVRNDDFFVYTFAKSVLENKTIYRIFFLFYGNDLDIVKSCVNKIHQFQDAI
ncbi:ATP-grasp domain-containing protein [Paenibacillus melissococcoides]|uniref:ATP-grasp domain-containing protein n=1 Tax=Paenibacillus melissococcoides TaxID=2912268 RepID=UPI0038B26BAF